MVGLIAKRVAAMVVVLLVLTAIVFGVQQLSPTDPVHNYLGANSTPGADRGGAPQARLRQAVARCSTCATCADLLHGNMQTSLRTRQPVATDLRHALPATLELAFAAMLIAAVLAIFLGVASAARWRGAGRLPVHPRRGRIDPGVPGRDSRHRALLQPSALGAGSGPHRRTSTRRPGRPVCSRSTVCCTAGPSVTIDAIQTPHASRRIAVALVPAVSVGRVLRSSITNALQSDYVRTARAKGLSERTVLLRHTLRNSAGAALSMGGLQVGLMFAGRAWSSRSCTTGPASACTPTRASTGPTCRRSPGSRCCSARST